MNESSQSESSLAADQLCQDPRVEEAKQLLMAALKDSKKSLTGVKAADPSKAHSYQQLLDQAALYRGSKLFFPYIGSGIGKGALVELLDGSVKYDFIGGIGPQYWGHSADILLEAGIEAALSDTIMQGNLQQNKDAVELMRLLKEASDLDHCFLTSSGVMANENALKMCFQKKFPAQRILAFEKCFAGRTLAFSQITDKPAYREGLPLNYFVDYIPFFDAEHPEESTKRAVQCLKAHLKRYPKQHAAMCFELVQGEGGFYTAPREFFVALMEVLKAEGILIFIDEIQTFGRLSRLFAYQHFELEPYVDIVSIGKLSQTCATLFKKELTPRAGLISQTFIASTSAIKAGTAIIKHLLSGHFFGESGKIEQTHKKFVARFEDIQARYPQLIKGPYGIGAMIAFTPFDGNATKVNEFIHALFQAGVISFIAGANPTRVRFLIPIGVLVDDDIQKALDIVEKTLVQMQG